MTHPQFVPCMRRGHTALSFRQRSCLLSICPIVFIHTHCDWIFTSGQTRSFGDVGSMSGLLESGHGWTI